MVSETENVHAVSTYSSSRLKLTETTDEFESLKPVGTREKCEVSYQNKSRNRYTNVLAYDKTRVKLQILPVS